MSQIKERPILFSAPMVRAILEGRKTVTRRAVKGLKTDNPVITCADGSPIRSGACWDIGKSIIHCPYGKPGDRLWVRETFIDLRGTGVEHRPDPDGPLQRYAYAADCRPGSHSDEARKDFGLKYKPSIHMPRAACRILLEITAVRVERLQDITPEQITAEGVSTRGEAMWGSRWWVDAPDQAIEDARNGFSDLWTSTGGDWDANPWVWAVSFKRVTP